MKDALTREKLGKAAWKLAAGAGGEHAVRAGSGPVCAAQWLITGGTTGLGLAAQYFFGLPLSAFVGVFNAAMFLAGLLVLGKVFALTTVISPLLPLYFGGAARGAGRGAPDRGPPAGHGAGRGDDWRGHWHCHPGGGLHRRHGHPALVLQKKLRIPVSISLYAFDCAILLLQALFSNVEQVLYGLVLVLLYTLTLNKTLMAGTGRCS